MALLLGFFFLFRILGQIPGVRIKTGAYSCSVTITDIWCGARIAIRDKSNMFWQRLFSDNHTLLARGCHHNNDMFVYFFVGLRWQSLGRVESRPSWSYTQKYFFFHYILCISQSKVYIENRIRTPLSRDSCNGQRITTNKAGSRHFFAFLQGFRFNTELLLTTLI